MAGLLRSRARVFLDAAAKALEETRYEFDESVYRPRRHGGDLLELAARLERPEEEGSLYRPPLLRALEILHKIGRWQDGIPDSEGSPPR
jgi:hypothetical protein